MAAIPIRVFISSPGDVGQERMIASRVLERLQGEFSGYVEITPILWEHEPLRATSHFQKQIIAPSQTDIVVCILWSRLGTRLPDQFKRADGTLYSSGTEWEFEDAYASFKETGKPDLMVYRKMTEPIIDLHDEAAAQEKLRQKKALDEFIDRWFGNAAEGFKAAFHGFTDADEYETTLDAHLRKLIRERIPERVADDAGASIQIKWFKGSPYRGLEAFDFEHAPVYFGRTKAIGAVKEALIRQAANSCAFVLVLGMSGGGKSSLIRAGVLPTITHPGVIEGVGLWRWSIFRPSDATGNLFDGLALALLDSTALPEMQNAPTPNPIVGQASLPVTGDSPSSSSRLGRGGEERAGVGSLLANELRTDTDAAVERIRNGLADAAAASAAEEKLSKPPKARLALYVDQLEEIFTRENIDEHTRNAFFDAIRALAKSGDVWVVASMRSDFYPRCAEIPALVEMKEGAGQYDLLPPSFAEIGQMIRYPTRAAGLRFESNPSTRESLDDVLHEAAARDPEALPLLEFTLDELFRQRTDDGILTFAAYQSLGGLEGALARRAEEVYNGLDPKVQQELDYILEGLITVDATGKIASRRTPMESLATNDNRRALIDAFVQARLLVTDRAAASSGTGEGTAVVRVAHEALLRHWPRIERWLTEHQDFLRIRERVATAANLWDQENRNPELLLPTGKLLVEAEDLLGRPGDLDAMVCEYIVTSKRYVVGAQRRRTGIGLGIAAAFFVVVTGFGLFSFGQWQTTKKNLALSLKLGNNLTHNIPNKLIDIPGARPVIRSVFEENAALLDQLAKLNRDSQAQREQELNLRYMGDVWRMLGDTGKAGQAYARALDIARTLATSSGTPQQQSDLAVALAKNGDIHAATGDFKGALDYYNQSQAILVKLNDPKLLHDLSSTYEKIGDVNLALNDANSAVAAYGHDLDIAQKLANAANDAAKTNPSPDNVDAASRAQGDVALSLTRVGDTQLTLGDIPAALGSYQRAQGLLEPLQTSLQSTLAAQTDYNDRVTTLKALQSTVTRALEACYLKIGDAKTAQGQAKDAATDYARALPIALERASDKTNIDAQHDLLAVYTKIGNNRLALGDMPGALTAFRSGLPLAQELAKDKDNANAQAELANTQQMLASLGGAAKG
jgi:tetratricopeptide (TPR) repeat protein